MFLLSEENLLAQSHLPVIQVMDAIGSADFTSAMHALCTGIGFGNNAGGCSFWDSLDEYDQANTDKFDGVLFETEWGESVIISYSELLHYIKIASEHYIYEYPSEKDAIIADIEHYKQAYLG